jgi:hypothetical protein
MVDRRLARSALVIVGIALCVFGPSRLAADSHANDLSHGTVVVSGSAVTGGDHATAPRSPISFVEGWVYALGSRAVVLIVAPTLAWTVLVAERRRVTVAPLAASWRRRGPPTPLG